MNLSHAQGELLAQVRPSGTTPTLAFTASNLRTEITLILCTIDPTSGPAELDVALYQDDSGGGTYDQTTIILAETRLQLLQSNILHQARHPGSGITLKPGGQLAVQTSDANDATFSIYGITETLAERVVGRT